jgi:hypothetical protein
MAVWANVEPVARTMARAPNRRAATFIVLSPLSKILIFSRESHRDGLLSVDHCSPPSAIADVGKQ